MNTEESEISYCVRIVENTAYYNDHNYLCWQNDPSDSYVISADSVGELYEYIANHYNTWQLYVERQRTGYSDKYKFEVSEIYIVIEEYDESKMKKTENYKKLSLLRDAAAKKEKERLEEQRKRDLAFAAEQREKRDHEEFLRLSKKYSKS